MAFNTQDISVCVRPQRQLCQVQWALQLRRKRHRHRWLYLQRTLQVKPLGQIQ